MKRNYYFVLLVCLLSITSCDDHKQTVYLRFEDGFSLKNCDFVILNGITIGTKTNMELDKQFAPILTIEMDEKYSIPYDSQFQLYQRDLFSDAILITPGKSRRMIKEGDTIQGLEFATIPESDSVVRVFMREVKKAIIEIDSTQKTHR